MSGIETFLINIFFISVFLLLVPLLIERSPKLLSVTQKKTIVTVSAGLGIISCMVFPITILEGFFFDLRWIPAIVGGLYGGVPASIILIAITLAFRILIGGGGIYPTIIMGVVVLVFLIILTKTFNESSRKKKLIIGSCFSLVIGIVVLVVLNSLFYISISPSLILVYLILTPSTTLLVIYIIEVIHETIILNEKLIKAEKMEVVSHLASSISHEVRNPLAVVRGFLQMMEQMNVSDEKRAEFLKISIAEIDRANDIIRNYLTFAKPSLENIEIMDIREELEKVVNMISPLANMNCVELKGKIDQSYFIKGEPQLIQQCLLNITKNCLEAMPDGGTLSIKTSQVHKELRIEITDSGQGMTEEQLSRIGEPYFTTKGREGTGLGMMTAIQIIKMMKGRINVKSKLKKGTTFYIFLPLVDKEFSEVAAAINSSEQQFTRDHSYIT
ncbi:two-component sensor histidine kinase [Anaerobacillus sp. CMMVII]|uniref:ATP-binding protein n=1 Tax=Anaerobacillus sp. CMMVII TaxID=2755588 RepID=UPI0021B83C4E|nr:sensor histidine kinase [Anaerobacillus sp. CMMVII]MCT8137301.1 two-component sensor histidine kinase [Anaerobacillus sp. CMMVII]